jgi:CRISPR-associated protein Cas2
MFVVVCYDIPDNKRRTRVGKTLEGYGYRVQKSVFECEVSPDLYQKMKRRVEKLVAKEEDSVRYYNLCQNCIGRVEICGLGEVQREKSLFVV